MGKRLAAVGAAAAIAVGGLAVAAANPLVGAGAQDGTSTTAPAPDGAAHRAGPLRRALDGLVADGTLTRAQADAVLAATEAEAEEGRVARTERRRDRRAAVLGAAAEALGSTPEAVRSGIADGTSIAAQAEAAGIDRSVVDDALTQALTERIDAAVAAGTLPEEQAAKARDGLDDAIDRLLDADGSRAGRRGGHLRGRVGERAGGRTGG